VGKVGKKTATLVTNKRNQGVRCRYQNKRHQPGLSIQPMCGHPDASVCVQPPACRPLVFSRPVPTLADVVDRLCDPEHNWRQFAHCTARARSEHEAATDARAATFTLGPYDDSYCAKNGLSLCRDMRNRSSYEHTKRG